VNDAATELTGIARELEGATARFKVHEEVEDVGEVPTLRPGRGAADQVAPARSTKAA
jgi:hypothetical protein